ncbi:MAG TPA: polysaccharide deacetylase family protein [Bacillota bacterium]|nr:polysaccharide deacetylase family protein [Bacillota bacterium]
MKTCCFSLSRIKKAAASGSLFFLITLLLTSALLKHGGMPSAQTKPHAVCKVITEKKAAALTFDINWGSRVPGAVLDVLKKQDVKATFFVSGSWAGQYPETARRITAEGHEIGNIGYPPIDRAAMTKSTVKKELVKSGESIREATGSTAALLRTPGGNGNGPVLAAASESGYTVIKWSVDSQDIQTPGKNSIISNVTGKVHPGAIILMNACDTASETPGALPAVIERLKSAGYELVTVSSLLELGPGVAD